MGLKQEVLTLLEENREHYVSGQEIANQLSFSRTAVWKAIKALKEDGYEIEAISNKGYRLSQNCDCLSKEGIYCYLSEENRNIPIEVYQQIDSTNTKAKKEAMNGARHGTIILAEEQTAGRGRLGRSFYSPKGTGIYMSLVLRPQLHLSQSMYVTTSVAVAICRVIERLTKHQPKIKWVNDIYLDSKKICGILTEALTDFESGQVQAIILGIGLNVSTQDFPLELQSLATSLNPEALTRNQICAALLDEILSLKDSLTTPDLLEEYKARSNVLGKWVTFTKNNKTYEALAVDIDVEGRLIVQLKEGKEMLLNSGEISVRGI
ncbi:MAG: biotin--[acetyl-CoA-carboxylase] ligase [Turicibacter sp.]|nr:biotin--[acetyl-CoA-carboxylase] ligase [Turicibacter sp.]